MKEITGCLGFIGEKMYLFDSHEEFEKELHGLGYYFADPLALLDSLRELTEYHAEEMEEEE